MLAATIAGTPSVHSATSATRSSFLFSSWVSTRLVMNMRADVLWAGPILIPPVLVLLRIAHARVSFGVGAHALFFANVDTSFWERLTWLQMSGGQADLSKMENTIRRHPKREGT